MATRPSEQLVDLLNTQIAMEFGNHNTYLALAAWCEDRSLSGLSAFYRGQAYEEYMHAMLIYTWTLAAPSLSVLQQPQLAQRHQEADAWLRQRQEERERQEQLQREQQQREQQQRDTSKRLPPQMAKVQMGRNATPHH